MSIKLLKPSFILVILLLSFGCGNNEEPADRFTLGDISTVSSFTYYGDSDIPLFSENINGGFNWKNYGILLDLNGDDTYDLNLFYNQQIGIDGTELYYSSIASFNSSFKTIGQTGQLSDRERWFPQVFNEAQTISLSEFELGTDLSETYLSFLAIESGQVSISMNNFPSAGASGYIVFQMQDQNNREIMGWLHIEQFSDLKGIKLIDVGFNYLD